MKNIGLSRNSFKFVGFRWEFGKNWTAFERIITKTRINPRDKLWQMTESVDGRGKVKLRPFERGTIGPRTPHPRAGEPKSNSFNDKVN